MTLPVSDGSGKIHAVASIATLAFMAWPKEPREAFVVADTWRRDLMLTADGSVSNFVQRLLEQMTGARATGGRLAGQILLHHLSLSAHYSEHASINKAQFLVHRHFMRDSLSGPTGMRSLKSYWVEFQPAVHLWAALVKYPPLFSADISEFIRMSEIIAKTSEYYEIRLAPLWRLPPDVSPVTSFLFDIPKLTAEGEAALQQYQAPRIAQ
jgi:hypothetical protein